MFGFASKTLRSGSVEFPTASALVVYMVTDLASSSHWNWVTFATTGSKSFVEVAVDGDHLHVNFAYPYAEAYGDLFAQRGITIPDDWNVKDFRTPSWLRRGAMLVTTRGFDLERVTHFVTVLFSSLYDVPEDATLIGTFQN